MTGAERRTEPTGGLVEAPRAEVGTSLGDGSESLTDVVVYKPDATPGEDLSA